MTLYDNPLYQADVARVAELIPIEKIADKSVVVSGATGLVGSFLVDALMEKNASADAGVELYVLSRNLDNARRRFAPFAESPHLHFVRYDASEPFDGNEIQRADFVLHLASNTHPLQYSADPIGTVMTNVLGLRNLLEFACAKTAKRFAFASSNEIYGENRGDVELFDENYCGYINCNTMRAGYPESKRCGEALCHAYRAQKGLDFVIPRLTRSYGPTMLPTDSKAISQFIKKGIARENIVLKSAGTQFYSYSYVSDAVSGLLYALLSGVAGEAYNIADEASDITLRDLATTIAEYVGKEVVFEIPDAAEAAGYSKATKARLDGAKLKALGWSPAYDVRTGVRRTIDILRSLQ